jgi:hypothetical protein
LTFLDEEAIACFKRLENLEKIRRTNGPALTLPVDNKISVTSSVGVGKTKKPSLKMWCHLCEKITTIRLIAEQLLSPSSKRSSF